MKMETNQSAPVAEIKTGTKKIWRVSVDESAGVLPFENESGTIHQVGFERKGTHEFVVKAENAEEAVQMVQEFTADWTYDAKLADEFYVAEFERMRENQAKMRE
jgi:hypothetical protein